MNTNIFATGGWFIFGIRPNFDENLSFQNFYGCIDAPTVFAAGSALRMNSEGKDIETLSAIWRD